jgi:hypothetical protein
VLAKYEESLDVENNFSTERPTRRNNRTRKR